jgi:predicted  nucleic acid-binding Zn-ribbon protein
MQLTRAVRAFHTGLVSETYRHLHVLRAFERHINVLRHSERELSEKLVAAEASWRELRQLEQLKQPWRQTHRDLSHTLRRLRTLLERIARNDGPRRKFVHG